MSQREIYDRHYARRAALQRELLEHPHLRDFHDRLADRVLAVAGGPPGGELRVLEIACGEGLFGAALVGRAEATRRTIQYTGADISASAVELARRVTPGEYIVGDATEVAARLPSGSFDLVVVKNLLHHLPDATPFLREVARILADPGRFVAAEASLGSPQAWFFSVLAPRRERYFFVATRRRVRRHHEAAGLEVLATDPFSLLPYEQAFVIRPGLGRRLMPGHDGRRVRRLSEMDDRLARMVPAVAAYRVWVSTPG